MKKNSKHVSVKIDREDYERVGAFADTHGRSIASQMRIIIREWFKPFPPRREA